MKEQVVSFQTAKLVKEVGFDWETEKFYTNPLKPYATKGLEYQSESYVRFWKWNSIPGNYPTKAKDVLCAAPTQSLLQKWLREEYNIFVCPFIVSKITFNNMLRLKNVAEHEYYEFHIKVGYTKDGDWIKTFTVYGETYEESLEKGLYKALTWIKENKDD